MDCKHCGNAWFGGKHACQIGFDRMSEFIDHVELREDFDRFIKASDEGMLTSWTLTATTALPATTSSVGKVRVVHPKGEPEA